MKVGGVIQIDSEVLYKTYQPKAYKLKKLPHPIIPTSICWTNSSVSILFYIFD